MPRRSNQGHPHVGLKVLPQTTEARLARARALERSGRYEEARDALGDLWPGLGCRPSVDTLERETAAEVILCVGVIAGRLGSAKQSGVNASSAKDLVSESFTRFEQLGEFSRAAEPMIELGHCYWREGAYDEARILLRDALTRIGGPEHELRALAMLRLAVVEKTAGRFSDAYRVLEDCRPLLNEAFSPFLKGNFYNTYANVLKRVGKTDEALIAYAEASYHFEQAGHARYSARVENNLAMLFLQVGDHGEAHKHLDKAHALFTGLGDEGSLAQVNETRARVWVAQRRYDNALRSIRLTVATLDCGGEPALLAEALTTQGVALARAGYREQARASLDRALSVAEEAGDREGAGRAALTIIEELGERTPPHDLGRLYERACELLEGSQDDPALDRLIACSQSVLRYLSRGHVQPESVRGTVYQFPHPRNETFTAYVPDESLVEAGIPKDSPVKFCLTQVWKEGDLVFAVTPDGNFMAFIYRDSAEDVRLEGANEACPVRTYMEGELLVVGVRLEALPKKLTINSK